MAHPEPRCDALAIALLISTTVAFYLQAACAECRLTLRLDPDSSRLSISAFLALNNPSFYNNPINDKAAFDPTAASGLSGGLTLTSNTLSACPPASDRSAWLSSGASFTFASVPQQPLATYPRQHLGRTSSAANANPPKFDLNLTDLTLTLDGSDVTVSYSYDVAAGGDSWDYGINWRSSLISGILDSDNALTGKRSDSIANLTASTAAVPAILDVRSLGGRPALWFEVPRLTLSYQAVSATKLELFGLDYNAWAVFNITTRLVAKAYLDCASDCGPGGSCGDSGACVCDCGWAADSTGACSVKTAGTDCQAALPSSSPPSLSPASRRPPSSASSASPPPPASPPRSPRPPHPAPSASRFTTAPAVPPITSLPSPSPPPPPSPSPSTAAATPSYVLRLSIAVEGVDSAALAADAAAQNGLASAIAAVAATGGQAQGQVLAARALTVAAQSSADGGAAVIALQLGSNSAAGAGLTAAAAQSSFDALQAATLDLSLQKALRGGRLALLAKAKVRALAGQVQQQGAGAGVPQGRRRLLVAVADEEQQEREQRVLRRRRLPLLRGSGL